MRFLPTAATGLLHAKKVNLSHNQPRNSNRIAATFRCDLSDQIGWKINVIKIKLRYFLATNIMLICWEFSSKTWWYIYIYICNICMYIYIYTCLRYLQQQNQVEPNIGMWIIARLPTIKGICRPEVQHAQPTQLPVEVEHPWQWKTEMRPEHFLYPFPAICYSFPVVKPFAFRHVLAVPPWFQVCWQKGLGDAKGWSASHQLGRSSSSWWLNKSFSMFFWCFWDDLSSWILHEIHEWNIWNGGILHWNWNPNLDQCQAYVGSSWESCMNSELTNIWGSQNYHPPPNFKLRHGTKIWYSRAARQGGRKPFSHQDCVEQAQSGHLHCGTVLVLIS